jgi:RES domain-containing protein
VTLGRRYVGLLYRPLNPVYAREPLSGRGASLYGGRFNRKGVDALYTSLDPQTAIREANQVGALQPTTLVAYRADLAAVFDTQDPGALTERGLTPEALADPAWRARMNDGAAVPTQTLADGLAGEGYTGLIVRSSARGAPPDALNLALWRWNTGGDDRLEVVDDEGRLSRI